MSKARETATVLQILLWYDQPEIVLLKRSSTEYILAVSSGHAQDDDGLFVGASLTLSQVADYSAGKFDLRYAMAHANFRRYWIFSFDGFQEEVKLARLSKSSDIVATSLPDSGFFSREHHKIELVEEIVPDTVESFDIDGSWELGEFSRFYGQLEDIYYIFNDIERFRDPNVSNSTKQVISKAFERPWKGGGSYVAFYDKIANDNAPNARLGVSGIKYNSPGYVAVKAKKKPFDDIIVLLQSYSDYTVEIRGSYNALYQFLSFSGLLKTQDDRSAFVSDVTRETIVTLASKLDTYMPGVSFQSFMDMAGQSEVVAAKVLMSVYRRMVRLYKFFEEGRVAYEGLDTTPQADSDDA